MPEARAAHHPKLDTNHPEKPSGLPEPHQSHTRSPDLTHLVRRLCALWTGRGSYCTKGFRATGPCGKSKTLYLLRMRLSLFLQYLHGTKEGRKFVAAASYNPPVLEKENHDAANRDTRGLHGGRAALY